MLRDAMAENGYNLPSLWGITHFNDITPAVLNLWQLVVTHPHNSARFPIVDICPQNGHFSCNGFSRVVPNIRI